MKMNKILACVALVGALTVAGSMTGYASEYYGFTEVNGDVDKRTFELIYADLYGTSDTVAGGEGSKVNTIIKKELKGSFFNFLVFPKVIVLLLLKSCAQH